MPLTSTKRESSDQKVTLSVICSMHNAKDFLSRYLESINQQTLEEFELVIIDACSSDGSLEITKSSKLRAGIDKKIMRLDGREGIYTAWNHAIRNSSGQWIINYNCDDYLFPEALEILSYYASQAKGASIIYSNCLVSSTPDHKSIISASHWRDANLPNSLEKGCCCGPFPLVNRSCYEMHGLFNESFTFSGDYEMWCRLKQKGTKFIHLQTYLGIYYMNPEGLSTSPKNQELRRLEDILARLSLTKQQASIDSPPYPNP